MASPTSPPPPSDAKPPDSPLRNAILITVSLVALGLASWYIYRQANPPAYSFEIPEGEKQTNLDSVTAEQLLDLPLTNAEGKPVSLRDQLGKRHLVIVFTRGSQASVPSLRKGPQLPGVPNVCAYCSSQASGIASQMPEFQRQDAEVLVVFPVMTTAEKNDTQTLKNSIGAADQPAPFPILIDLKLQAVDQLGIRAHLALPASFIIDKRGNLRFAYVAKQGSADRPSAGELLRHVTLINAEINAENTSP